MKKTMTEQFLIWWTTQADCQALEESFLSVELVGAGGVVEDRRIDGLPDYLNREFQSRTGRSGRGRLWVADELGLPVHYKIQWDDRKTAVRKLSFANYAGIVLRVEDLAAVIALPGFVTDTELNLVGEILVAESEQRALPSFGLWSVPPPEK